MSENLKLRLDALPSDNSNDRLVRGTDPAAQDGGPIDEAESQMRKALGLLGESPRSRPDQDRMEHPARMGDRFGAGGLHRRRFVQDGEVQVTVLRRDQANEAPAHRGVAPLNAPTTSRLQRTEAALAAETSAREKAERALAEMHALARDLQTKIGHAELTKAEATEALRREREAIAQLRADAEASADRLREVQAELHGSEQAAESYRDQLAEERVARKAAEKALRAAETARETAEQLVRALSEEAPAARHVDPVRRPRAEPEVVAATTRRPKVAAVVADPAAAAPEPVKWWLNTKPTGKRK